MSFMHAPLEIAWMNNGTRGRDWFAHDKNRDTA
jgi:hypothetical protein